MSEYIGMSIEIGGELNEEHVDELLTTIKDTLGDQYQGPTDKQEFLTEVQFKKPIQWGGTSNYGLCQDVVNFCTKHHLSYIHHSEAAGEYDATLTYWIPGMEDSVNVHSDSNKDSLVSGTDLKPLIDLMLALLKSGREALPLFIGKSSLNYLVEIGLKDYPAMLSSLELKLSELIQLPPTIPPLTLTRG